MRKLAQLILVRSGPQESLVHLYYWVSWHLRQAEGERWGHHKDYLKEKLMAMGRVVLQQELVQLGQKGSKYSLEWKLGPNQWVGRMPARELRWVRKANFGRQYRVS